jgi:hypothetical protein
MPRGKARAAAAALVQDVLGDELRSLVGARVVQAEALDEAGEIWPVLALRHPDGRVVVLVVQADAEGNGPGFLRLEPQPAASRVEVGGIGAEADPARRATTR